VLPGDIEFMIRSLEKAGISLCSREGRGNADYRTGHFRVGKKGLGIYFMIRSSSFFKVFMLNGFTIRPRKTYRSEWAITGSLE
jgi:hypothetical protein